ncbi:hypothetical protein VCRA2114E365_40163 [Vibrio crassostreae]|nr:hypothetical protein EDB30_1137 [Vibrio crassostreae]TCT50917.1 hypothetical protein EDB42_10791 [Vibrio crassostreae]TCT73711.1 hypothetical protein EDB31_10182 [Vibrio crassostreae]TCT75586.1 hypothetical protein EDB41_10791 [Vibrio crassostreae]TCT94951.1 hypothetical protein EDB38_10791 [Vibrio crassostreae]
MSKLTELIKRLYIFFTRNKEKNLDISYVTKSGKNADAIQKPHKHENGKYVVSKTKFEKDYLYVESYEEIEQYLNKGYKLRVSCTMPKTAPSLVSPKSLTITK